MHIDGPYSLACSADEVVAAARTIVDEVIPTPPRSDFLLWIAGLALRREWRSVGMLLFQRRERHFSMERHLDSTVVRELCRDRRLREQLSAHLGDDMLLWRSEVWVSHPGEWLIPAWHHDAYPFLLRGEGRTINAYLALTDIETDNGFEYLPPAVLTGRSLETASIDRFSGNAFFHVLPELEASAVPVRLDAGQFVLFSDDLVHRSVRNTSGKTRVSLALRVATSSLRIQRGYSPIFKPVPL